MPNVIGAAAFDADKIYVERNVNQLGHGFTNNQPVYKDGTGTWQLAIANDAGTLKQGHTLIIDVNSFDVISYGNIDIPSHGFNVGSTYYLSDTTAGTYVEDAPEAFDSYQQACFEVVDGNSVKVVDQAVFGVSDTGLDPLIFGEIIDTDRLIEPGIGYIAQTAGNPLTLTLVDPTIVSAGMYYKILWAQETITGGQLVIDGNGTDLRDALTNNISPTATITQPEANGGEVTLYFDGALWNYYWQETFIPITAVSGGGVDDWTTSTLYAAGDYIRYAPTATLYKCEISHTSTSDFIADLNTGNWSHLTGYVNTAREFQGGLAQQTAYEQILYMRDNTTPRNPITVNVPPARDTLVPVAQYGAMTRQSGWTLTSNPLQATASTCDPSKFERRHVSWAGTYFTVGDFISFGSSSVTSGPRWEILRVGRTGASSYHYAEVSPDNCTSPCEQSPGASNFETWRPSGGGTGYIDPLAVTAVTDIGGGEFQIDLDDAHDGTGTAVLDDLWGSGHAIMQYDVNDPDTFFVIKSTPTSTSVICEPNATLPTTLVSSPSGWLPTVGTNLRTSGTNGPLARVTPTVTGVTDLGGDMYDVQFDFPIDGTGLNWTVGHAIVPLSDTSGNTYIALDSFTNANTLRMDAGQSFPVFYVPTVGITMNTAQTNALATPTLGEEPRTPVLDGELANKKYVDDQITTIPLPSTAGFIQGTAGLAVMPGGQLIPVAGAFGRGGAGTITMHWASDSGVHGSAIIDFAIEWNSGRLNVKYFGDISYMSDFRLRRETGTNNVYFGYVLTASTQIVNMDLAVQYTDTNPTATIRKNTGGINGTDHVVLPKASWTAM